MTDSGTTNEEAKAEKGFFYIMTNPAQLGLILIGTSARHPEERLLDDDLNGAGVPLPYEIRYYALVGDMKAAFDHVHARLASAHVDKYFYETTTGMAIDAIETAKVEILFRETDVSVHEISSAGRRPEPARLSRGQYRPQTPYATSLGEQRQRKQQALNRLVGDTPDGENIVPPEGPAPARPSAGASREPRTSQQQDVDRSPTMRTEPALVSVGTGGSASTNTVQAFDQNAVRDLESQSNLDVSPVDETAKDRFFKPEPAKSEPSPEKPAPAPEAKTARVHELRKADAPTALTPQVTEVPVESRKKPAAADPKPSIDELVEKQASEDLRAKAEAETKAKPKSTTKPAAKKKNARKANNKANKKRQAKKKQAANSKANVSAEAGTKNTAAQATQPELAEKAPSPQTPGKPDVQVNTGKEPKRELKPGTPLPIPSLSKRGKEQTPDTPAATTAVAATSDQPVPQTVAPAGIVYGPQGPVALHPIPGTPYMAVTPVQMSPGQNGGPAQPVVQTIEGPGGVTTAAPTGIATMANGAVNPQSPAHGALPSPQQQPGLPGVGAPAGAMAGAAGANPGDPAQLEAWLSEQDNAADKRSKNRRAILMSLLGIPVGAIGGGAYVVLNEGLNQSQIGAVIGGAVVGAMILFFLLGRFTGGKKKVDEFESEMPDYPRDRVDPTLD